MKKYSKKQITEAIAYWKNKLNEDYGEPEGLKFVEDGKNISLSDTISDLIDHAESMLKSGDPGVCLENPLGSFQIVIRPNGSKGLYSVSLEEDPTVDDDGIG